VGGYVCDAGAFVDAEIITHHATCNEFGLASRIV
jgi:hypothetical protein